MGEQIDFDHEHIKKLIKSEKYIFHGMTTICILTLGFGHRLVGQGHCLSQHRYDKQIGKDAARADAMSQLYAKESYRLQYRPPVV
ncbi:Gp49 family protein [uncultured Endozoicomonas sp.]|uniref:Gp49 family protein n=1 Tax=uncultured Endozoicomonas sp. TaxID=432652 RepID=UPI002631851D|nr:Gp49 family protein [uncultured Endozoicomonas sp.]